jgi:vancomycin resistance protein YoaR
LVLQGIKESFDTPPTSARLDLDSRQVIAEKPGRYLDENGAAEALESLIADGGDTLRVPVALFPPRISSAFVKALDISAVLGEYETFFSRGGDQARRGKNIDVASSKLDGLILSPGELVSFNAVVGERSEANGFQKSWEIFKGEMVEGTGGGTCQVASTFHAATFFAGLDVLERLPHSRPSAYIPMGLDSTVVYPSVDLKIKNPHPFPVVVHARTIGNKLKVEVLGRSKPVSVAFGRDVVATVPYTRKVTEEPGLSGKKIVVKQHGIRGYRIKRSRVLTYADGSKKVETTSDFYPPTTEIYQVPVGFDVSALPPLPAAEGDDKDPAAAPAAAPAAPAATSTAQPVADARPEVELVDGPGAHAPTAAQANPSKSVFLRR